MKLSEIPPELFFDERMFLFAINKTSENGRAHFDVSVHYNVEGFQLFRVEKCESLEGAKEFIRLMEPQTPITTHNGEPLPWDLAMEDCYEPWIDWLRVRGLKSALDNGYENPIAQR